MPANTFIRINYIICFILLCPLFSVTVINPSKDENIDIYNYLYQDNAETMQ